MKEMEYVISKLGLNSVKTRSVYSWNTLFCQTQVFLSLVHRNEEENTKNTHKYRDPHRWGMIMGMWMQREGHHHHHSHRRCPWAPPPLATADEREEGEGKYGRGTGRQRGSGRG